VGALYEKPKKWVSFARHQKVSIRLPITKI
jgi:hypothetical protein